MSNNSVNKINDNESSIDILTKGSPLSESPEEMIEQMDVEQTIENPAHVIINNGRRVVQELPDDSEELIAAAKENLDNLKQICTAAYVKLIREQKINVSSSEARSANADYNKAQFDYKLAAEAFQTFVSMNEVPVEKKVVLKTSSPKALVPPSLPYLQLASDSSPPKKNTEVFDSVFDFCKKFKTVLEAHTLEPDFHWERLLPICLNKEDQSWFEEKLKNKNLYWKQAESFILDHLETPYRRFLLMAKVGRMTQGKYESTKSYAAKYQRMRREAELPDGILLVCNFWCSLRGEVRKSSSVAVASQFGTKLPEKLEDMINVVVAATNENDIFSGVADSVHAPHRYKGSNQSGGYSILITIIVLTIMVIPAHFVAGLESINTDAKSF